MEKAIATVIITVASIAAIMTVLNALMPAISRTNTSIVSAADSVDSRISTQLDIIQVDAQGFLIGLHAGQRGAAATPGSWAITFSTSRGETLAPCALMRSSARPW